jgi:hypothetical protein
MEDQAVSATPPDAIQKQLEERLNLHLQRTEFEPLLEDADDLARECAALRRLCGEARDFIGGGSHELLTRLDNAFAGLPVEEAR